MNRAMLWILTAAALTGCAGHRLASYDITASAGRTEYSGNQSEFQTGGRVNLHFEVAK